MIKLDLLADALAGLRPVQAHPERCLPARSPRASCTRCREVCPEGAITLSPAPTLADCSGCGLCAAVCPGDALVPGAPSDEQLLQQVTRLARRQRQIAFTCDQPSGLRGGSAPHLIQNACPGRLRAEFLIAAAACGPDVITVVLPPEARCLTCSLHEGRELASSAVGKAARALAALGWAGRIVIADSLPAPEPRATQSAPVDPRLYQDRRAFLLGALGLVKQALPGQAKAEQAPAAEQPWTASGGPPRREMLAWAIKSLAASAAPSAPWPEPRITLTATCLHCGVCERLCPGKAIGLSGEVLAHDPLRCLGCGLCTAVCPVEALTLAPPGAPPPTVQPGAGPPVAAPLGAPTTAPCRTCGEPVTGTAPPGSQPPRCLPCALRPSSSEVIACD